MPDEEHDVRLDRLRDSTDLVDLERGQYIIFQGSGDYVP